VAAPTIYNSDIIEISMIIQTSQFSDAGRER